MPDKIQFIPDLKKKILNTVSVLTEQQNWGLSFINAQEAWRHSKGEGIKVAVIDTGWTEHQDLMPNFIEGHDATGNNDFIDRGNFHGCIFPTDKIYTNKNGIIEIKDLYNQVSPDAVYFCPKESSTIKLCSSEEIQTCSLLPDMEFNFSKIKCIHKLYHSGEIIKITTNKKTILKLTPWHPIFTNEGKIKAENLKVGMNILASQFENKINDLELVYKNYFECKFCGHVPRSGNGIRKQCKKCNKSKWCIPQEQKIKITEDLAFWLGLILSDGHVMTHSQSIEFCGNNENLINVFEKLTFNLFNKECHRYIDKRNNNFYRTRVHSKDIYDFVRFICGINSGAKSLNIDVPKIIQKSSSKVVGAFYAGVIEGDGCVYGKRIRLATASKLFAETSRFLLKTFGIDCGLEIRNNLKTNFSSESEMYYLDIQASHLIINHLIFKKFDYPKIQKRLHEKIKSIETLKFEGELYDLTVENTHNYIANGLVVSNTHVAGIVAANCGQNIGVMGVAPEAKLIPIKALSDDGSGSFDYIIKALEIARDLDVDVINMSLGSPVDPGNQKLHNMVQAVAAQGKIVVCASGNDGASVNFPAKYDEVIAVAAVEASGQLARFSSRGPELDTAAPGVKIYSTWGNNQYTNLDGTSMACPCISGMVALILSWYKLNPDPNFVKDYKNMIRLLYELGESTIIQTNEYNIGVPKFANFDPWKPVNG